MRCLKAEWKTVALEEARETRVDESHPDGSTLLRDLDGWVKVKGLREFVAHSEARPQLPKVEKGRKVQYMI